MHTLVKKDINNNNLITNAGLSPKGIPALIRNYHRKFSKNTLFFVKSQRHGNDGDRKSGGKIEGGMEWDFGKELKVYGLAEYHDSNGNYGEGRSR
jgi:hypothetical protein